MSQIDKDDVLLTDGEMNIIIEASSDNKKNLAQSLARYYAKKIARFLDSIRHKPSYVGKPIIFSMEPEEWEEVQIIMGVKDG